MKDARTRNPIVWVHTIGQASPGAATISARDLALGVPLLLNSGSGALGWWQLRQTDLRTLTTGQELHQAYRLHNLQVAVKEQELSQLFAYLQGHHLQPLLGNGWAIARHYPEPGLRPYGDFELYVPRAQYALYQLVLQRPEARGWSA